MFVTYLKGINGRFFFNVHHRHFLSTTTSVREALHEDIYLGDKHGVAALLQNRFLRMLPESIKSLLGAIHRQPSHWRIKSLPTDKQNYHRRETWSHNLRVTNKNLILFH